MNNHFERARVLVDQERYPVAEQELSKVLAAEPDHPSAHALLAICLSERGDLAAASLEIRRAIALSPEFSGFHYIYSGILNQQGKLTESKESIDEAIRLDPEDADYYARLARIQIDQLKYEEAIKSTEYGLSLEAENVSCLNLRLLALLKQGQLSQVIADVEVALAQAPENSFPYAIKGWAFLHQDQVPTAIESFQEALRLRPEFDWARDGLVEALKAKNSLYRLILRFDLWRARLNNRQIFVLVALIVIFPPLRVLFFLFLLLIWISRPLLNLMSRQDLLERRLTQNPREPWPIKTIVLILLPFLLSGVVAFVTQKLAWIFIWPTLLVVGYSASLMRGSKLTRDQKIKLGFLLPIGVSAVCIEFAVVLTDTGVREGLAYLATALIMLTLVAVILFVFGLLVYKTAMALLQVWNKSRKF